MATFDLWSVVKGTLQFATSATSPRRFRLTDHKYDGSGNSWRPWDALEVDCQHISGAVYVAFGGTEATQTLATGPADETRTTFRIQGRTRILFAAKATSISILTPTAATNVFVDLFKF